MKQHPDVAAQIEALRETPPEDAAARARVAAAVAALKDLRRDRPDLFTPEAARLVRPSAAPPSAGAPVEAPRVARTPGDPLPVLRDVFGFPSFRPGQRELVDAVLAGRDALGVLPTGSGKSLTY